MNLHVNSVHGLAKPRSTGVHVAHTASLHLFTCIVAICTHEWKDGVGEKIFIKCTGNHRASPATYYLGYGQWQPLYFEVLESIPGIEFYEGVPDDI